METVKRLIPISGQEGLKELMQIAIIFEENIYSAATNQTDYLRKISEKILTMESIKQNPPPKALTSNSVFVGMNRNPQDLVPSQDMQSQVHNQGQSVPIQMGSNQSQALLQLLAQIQNLTISAMQTSASLPNSLPPVMLADACSSSLDSNAQTGGANAGDWQEEVYQKIKVMKDLYFADLNEKYQEICSKLQQHDSLPQPPKTEQLEKLRLFKQMLEKLMFYLQTTKSNIGPSHRDKLASFEKQIISLLNALRPRKPVPSMQGPPQLLSILQPGTQLPHSQHPQAQSHDNGANPQLQSMNLQGSVAMSNMSSLQRGFAPSLSAITSLQQSIPTSLQPSSNMDSGQGNAPSSMQQVAMASLQQNSISAPQQADIPLTEVLRSTSFFKGSLDFTAQTGGANAGDWQEEVYQKIKIMKDLYFTDLNEMYQEICSTVQQHDSLHQPYNTEHEKLRLFKQILEKLMFFLQTTKDDIEPSHRDKLPSFENQIISLLKYSHMLRKPVP